MLQSGCTFNNLSVLNLIPQPPIPSLKIADLKSVASTSSKDTDVTAACNIGKIKREELNLHSLPSSTSFTSTSSSGGYDAEFDEFTDFQSALSTPGETTSSIKEQVSTEKPPEIQSSALTILPSDVGAVQKCPGVMVVSSIGHGRGIGSRLANHSLGTPKQKKSKHHHHHHHRSQSHVPISLDEDFSEFQQAKDPEAPTPISGDRTADEVFPKCTVKTPQGKKTYLLKESAIRAEMKLEGNQQTIVAVRDDDPVSLEGTLSDFEEIIQSKNTVLPPEISKSAGTKQDQHVLLEGHTELRHESKTSVSCPRESKSEGVNLMSVEEDKYSALRNLSLVGQDAGPEKPQLFINTEQSPASDDFGDFLSAEPVEGVDDSFADIAARKQAPCKNLADLGSVNVWKTADSPHTAEFHVDDWGEYKGAPSCDTGSYLNHTFDMAGENKLSNTTNRIKLETDISTVFMDLHLGKDSCNVLDSKDNDIGVAGDGKEKASDLLSLVEPSTDLNISNSLDFKLEDGSDSHGDPTLNTSERVGHSSTFQGFLGKICGDFKNEHYSTKMDMLWSSLDDQLHGSRSDSFDIDVKTHGGDDDFGEFVGPDAWSEEQKYNAATKDILFDSHLGQGLKDGLYGDSQSVSSLELPPLALSRHGSLPSLDLKIFPSITDKNDGNDGNQPWDMSPQVCLLLTKNNG
jgi:hypothetical protein